MIQYSKEVETAIHGGAPVVALESTIISHGLPRPTNLTVARDVEEIVRSRGAVPATIAIIRGVIHVGLESAELELVANLDGIRKASIRDLPVVTARLLSAATTVAATSHLAHQAGISIFATGGLGGVHRGAQESWDESADLHSLATIPVMVISAGAKSILDVAATLERLETLSVPIVGYRTSRFPGFYLADSGFDVEYRVDSPEEIAAIWRKRNFVGVSRSGMVIANPVEKQMDPKLHAEILEKGMKAASVSSVSGKAVTPFLLDYFHRNTNGESLRVNIDIIKANAALAADIAIALKKD